MIQKRGLVGSKRGSGHLEMIFSFVFFIGFIFFLFMTLNPYESKSLLESISIGLANSLWNNGETNLTTFFLKANISSMSSGKDCFFLQLQKGNIFDFDIANSYVEDVDGNKINSTFEIETSSGEKEIKLTINKDSDHYKIFLSPEFENDVLGGGCEKMDDFTMGNIIKRKVLSNKSLTTLHERYYSEYNIIKAELGVPEIFDFSITSEEMPELNMEKIAPESDEVFARDYLFEVLTEKGEIINSRFNIRVW